MGSGAIGALRYRSIPDTRRSAPIEKRTRKANPGHPMPLVQLVRPRATNAPRRPYGSPVNTDKEQTRFEPLPALTRNNLTLPLEVVLPTAAAVATETGVLSFHAVGDTGGEHGTDMQTAVAAAMEAQIAGASADAPGTPAFLFHLGDVIYSSRQSTLYHEQFYEPYKFYPRHIFAIPGNRDGNTQVLPGDPIDTEPSLYGFLKNFCDAVPERLFDYRDTMTQPYVYWTLDAPLVTIVGLYSNVDGTLDGRGTVEQQQWFEQQLLAADSATCLLVTVHHPPYSLDSDNGGYPQIGTAIDRAIQTVTTAGRGRVPDAILSGHIHDYQRFTRTIGDREIPYIIAGAGGYANTVNLLHHLQRKAPATPVPVPLQTTMPDVVLESYDETDAGFLRVTIDARSLTIEYFAVAFNPRQAQPSTGAQPAAAATPYDPSTVPRHDIVTLDLTTHKLTVNGNAHVGRSAAGGRARRPVRG